MRKALTAVFVKTAKALPGKDRTVYWDKATAGFGLMVTSGGHKSFVFQYRVGTTSRRMNLDGKFLRIEAERAKKGDASPKTGTPLVNARREAQVARAAISNGRDPLAECRKVETDKTSALKKLGEKYLASDKVKNLRSVEQRKRILERYIYPTLGTRIIDTIKKSEIDKLLERIAEKNGPVMADQTLAVLRHFMVWHATKSDDFRSPIVRGMALTKPKDRARQRTLNDDEIRAVWKAAEASGTAYGHMLRFILLTATRLREAASMSRKEVRGDEWFIPAARHKSKEEFLLPLSASAQAVLAKVPQIGRAGFVFTTNGKGPISGFSKWKSAFDKECGATAWKEGWTTHDLRRTARTLMSRARVPSAYAERALGHVLKGIERTYDVHDYRDEKREAFEALAAQIERILNPSANVIELSQARLG